MSYKYEVIKDHPIAFFPISTISAGVVETYQDLIDNYADYTAVLNAFESYSDIITNTVTDYSGCENNAQYVGTMSGTAMPLVAGNKYSVYIDHAKSLIVPITKDYYSATAKGGFATKYYNDNDFSIEIWVKPHIYSTTKTVIFADEGNNVGLFWENGNLLFNVNTDGVEYTVPDFNQILHLVAVYSINNISLYVNNELVVTKNISNDVFQNAATSLAVGPTEASGDYFLCDSPAVYRYALNSNQISRHFNFAKTIPVIQMVYPEDGELFELYDDGSSIYFEYSYPEDKSWNYFLNSDLYFDQTENSLAILKTESPSSKTVILEDYVMVPSGLTLDSSKIEWHGNNGVTVESSIDGINYTSCVNGGPIPQYKLNSFASDYKVYLKITMASSNTAKYLPKITSLKIKFYNDQRISSKNGTSYITTMESDSGLSSYDLSLGDVLHPILSRNQFDGIQTFSGSGFYLNTSKSVKTIEFLYTPSQVLAGGLISGSSTYYRWDSNKDIAKSNISKIYVNGEDYSLSTNANTIFSEDETCHVLIILTTAKTGQFKFNHTSASQISAQYQNIAIYERTFTPAEAADKYSLYVQNEPTIVTDSGITLTENDIKYYNNGWTVQQTV